MTPSPTPPDRGAADHLQAQLQRLYLLPPPMPGGSAPAGASTSAASPLVDADGLVRALVMQVGQPPGWDALAPVWRGVQTDLDLPAPAVAVSGTDGLQLWFSLAQPVPLAQALAFLQALRQRFVPELQPRRLHLLPDASATSIGDPAGLLPVRQVQPGQWSAFVAADLAPVFADTPWLDGAPNLEGQAALLRGLASITPAAWTQALALLDPPDAAVDPPAPRPSPSPVPVAADDDPRRFLRQVMNDPSAPLALRVDAAKALLQQGDTVPPGD